MSKKVVAFVSNFMNHHQLPVALEMNQLYDYTFVATEPIAQEQVKMKYEDMNKKYDFILCSYESEENYKKALEIINNADVVIFGACSFDMVRSRIINNKLTFKYSERLFKDKTLIRKVASWKKYYFQCTRYKTKNYHLLCASAYAAKDYAWFGAFKNKTYKWGYFPPIEELDVDEVFNERVKNNKLKLAWCNRLIRYKHPDMAILAAKYLKDNGIDCEINIMGVGYLKEKLEGLVKKYKLEEQVNILGSMPTTEVRKILKQSDIALLTADKGEGWGAVVNEAMNSCCAVLCNKFTGSVPFLVEDGVSGMMYKNNKEFFEKLKILANNQELREKLGRNAYNNLLENWSPKKAVENFDKLINAIQNNKEIEIAFGPCSRCN